MVIGRYHKLWRSGSEPAVPAGVALYAVGDIHGRADLLTKLLDAVVTDSKKFQQDRMRVIVFLGDFIDRGPESRQVLDCLIAGPPAGFEAVHLIGNHEDALLGFLDANYDGRGWLQFGGLETILSYRLSVPRSANILEGGEWVRDILLKEIPTDHLNFLRSCYTSFNLGNYFFVHAGVRPGVALSRQREKDLLTIREPFLSFKGNFEDKIIVHGHTICEVPEVLSNRINIDTGAYASGYLTSLVLRGGCRGLLTVVQGRGLPIWTDISISKGFTDHGR